VAGIVYLIVTVIASMIVPTATLAGSDGPLLEVVQVGRWPCRPRSSARSRCSRWPTAR
jgi:hypothetical protein